MSQPVLWVIHTNKCGSVQLLGHYTVPYEIYPLMDCLCYLMYSNLCEFMRFVLNLQEEGISVSSTRLLSYLSKMYHSWPIQLSLIVFTPMPHI